MKCENCSGSGKVHSHNDCCWECDGTGTVPPSYSIATDPQPPPQPGNNVEVVMLVMADLALRKQQGIAKYGTTLQPHNGRDALIDAYQESLDLCQYLRQAIYERYGR